MMSGRAMHAVALTILAVLGNRTLAAEPGRVEGWIMNDLAAAQAEARKTGKPIFATIRCER